MAFKRFRPTAAPPLLTAPDTLLVDRIIISGLGAPSGLTIRIDTIWVTAAGAPSGMTGPSRTISGSNGAMLRNQTAWEDFIESILLEMKSAGLLIGNVV